MSIKDRVKEIKKEMNSGDRIYKTPTIGDMEEQGFMPLDLFKSEEFDKLKDMPVKLNDWDFFIKLMNASMTKGESFTKNTPWLEFLSEMGEALEATFLTKSSKNSSPNNLKNE